VPELKDRLRDLGLTVGGRKAELVERLQQHRAEAARTSTGSSMPPSSKRKSGASDGGAASPAKKKAAKKTKKAAADHQRQTERTPLPKLWDGAAATERSGSYTLRVCSWNVAGLRAVLKNTPQAIPDLVARHGIDVLCLQETKLQEVHVTDPKLKIGGHLLVEEGYDAHYSCSTTKKGYSGTAVFVKKRGGGGAKKQQASLSNFFGGAKKGGITDGRDMTNIGKVDAKDLVPEVSFGIGKSKHDGEGRSITLDFPRFTLTNLYVPNSGQKLERLDYRTEEWDKDLLEYMQGKEAGRKRPVIWLGDLNVAHKAADTWNEGAKHLAKSAGTTAQERASFERQLAAGYADAFRELHGEEALGHYSYWSQRAGNREPNKGLRLDYFICSKDMLKDSEDTKCVVRDSYMIPDQKGSDHCPVVLELEIKC
jgi:exodeoxyribonuclease-3